MLKNLRNLLPYFLLIAIYFFFINLEARKDRTNGRSFENENSMNNNKLNVEDEQLRIKIPVIPYKK